MHKIHQSVSNDNAMIHTLYNITPLSPKYSRKRKREREGEREVLLNKVIMSANCMLACAHVQARSHTHAHTHSELKKVKVKKGCGSGKKRAGQ